MKLYRIKKSNIDRKGRGLYATQDIKEGTKIIDYIGKIITKKQTEVSDKFDNAKPIYLFDLKKFVNNFEHSVLINSLSTAVFGCRIPSDNFEKPLFSSFAP